MQFLIIMVLMLGVMYVLMIRPQRQRQAQQQTMIGDAGVGDDVLTTGGIYGTITHAEGDDIVVEGELEGDEDADEGDEEAVTDGEEAVRSAVGEPSAGDGRG